MKSLHIRAATAAAALAACTLLAGCGGSGSTGSSASSDAPTAGASDQQMPGMPGMSAPATSAGAPVSTNAVLITNFQFSPATVTVPVGATVTWTNADEEPHTVVGPGSGMKSGGLGTGQKYSYTFGKAGTYTYFCSIHPFMHGTVVVTP